MDRPTRNTGLRTATHKILLAAFAVALVHHADHVLRVDHSGWPFRTAVTPFTFSLLAYPVLLFALYGPRRLFWWRWTGLAFGTALTIFAHSRLETPQMQYAMWAYNHSLEPALWSVRNLCGVESSGLGWAAVVVGMTLNILLVIATVGMFVDGFKTSRAEASAQ